MAREFKVLYWSSLEMYEQCPQKFLWSKGWKGIDLGFGVGERIPKPKESSMHHAVMGIAIAKAMEDLYNLQLYKDPATLKDRLLSSLEKEFKYLIHTKYIDWDKSPTEEEMYQICVDGILGFLRTMKHNKLLGEFSKSEVDMIVELKEGHLIGGRADLVVVRNGDVGIYDGKNSLNKGKYTNPDQLRWYGLLYQSSMGVVPKKLGFIYYRYPFGLDNDGVKEQGVDYIDFTVHHLSSLAERAIEARDKMEANIFDPKPQAKHCRFCDYESICDARKEQKLKASEKRKSNFDLKLGISGEKGNFVEFTLPK